VSTAVVLVVAADTRFGPTLLALSQRHGGHAGDTALVATYAAAGVLTRLTLAHGHAADQARGLAA
jgi:hypothetical protein